METLTLCVQQTVAYSPFKDDIVCMTHCTINTQGYCSYVPCYLYATTYKVMHGSILDSKPWMEKSWIELKLFGKCNCINLSLYKARLIILLKCR